MILDNKRLDTNSSNPYEPSSADFFMDEESLRFWIIPIVCIVAVLGIFSVSLEYKVNTVFPNAELERMEIKNMSCDEIIAKDSANDYWTSENSQNAAVTIVAEVGTPCDRVVNIMNIAARLKVKAIIATEPRE